MKIFTGLFFCFFISSCTQTSSYSDSKTSIHSINDKKLVKDAIAHKTYLSSVFSTEYAQNEYSTILNELKSRHPEWLWNEILNNSAQVGMTKNELLLSWGKPYSTNNKKSYWIYKTGESKRRVDFLNDKIKRIFVKKVFKTNSSSKPMSF